MAAMVGAESDLRSVRKFVANQRSALAVSRRLRRKREAETMVGWPHETHHLLRKSDRRIEGPRGPDAPV